jgi:hypothetical protein
MWRVEPEFDARMRMRALDGNIESSVRRVTATECVD